jgi:hypothetical protein
MIKKIHKIRARATTLGAIALLATFVGTISLVLYMVFLQ